MGPGGFEGRHVVVSGGTGALGRAVVARLLAADARCHVPVFDERECDGLPWRADPRVTLAPGVDLTDEGATEAFFRGLPGVWASVHLAGGFSMAPLTRTSLVEWRRLMDLNATCCFLCCREAVARMREGGAGGRIVNVAARPALVPAGGMVAYSASKAAVVALTQALAEELAPEGIWVNAVAPSIIDTPANRRAMPDAPHERWPKPAELAETIVQLAAPANAVTRGAVVTVYGRA
jgi:NAD(P)-dependent dehydrogenase (short-subunit alcohol dehydrogenase family)